jgi:hypothetical protein
VTGWVWAAGAFAIPPLLAFLTFLLLYRVLPHRAARLLHVWPGALLAALAFELTKAGFATYVASFSNYQVVYGSLGGVIALLFWVMFRRLKPLLWIQGLLMLSMVLTLGFGGLLVGKLSIMSLGFAAIVLGIIVVSMKSGNWSRPVASKARHISPCVRPAL